jgi:hypothetical protein
MKIPMPEEISVYAIEIGRSDYFSERLTKVVNGSVDKCIQMILDEVSNRFGVELSHQEETR